MVLFKLYNKAKRQINKSSFKQKNIISFQAYELLKKYVVNGLVEARSLDSAYPKNTKLKVLKNVSHRSMHTFYKLSDRYSKNKKGVLSQSLKSDYHLFHKKKLSPKAKDLLKKIKNDEPRHEKLDKLISKFSQ
jgi:hypothetical protein